MQAFWRRRDGIDSELRALRAEPRSEFADGLEDGIRSQVTRSGRVRLGVLVATTAGMLVTLASVGGVGYAASSIKQAEDVLQHITIVRHIMASPSSIDYTQADLSSAADQYGKVTICHKGVLLVPLFRSQFVLPNAIPPRERVVASFVTIGVDQNALPAFLSQGDTLDACSAGAFKPPVIGTSGNDNIKVGNGSVTVSAGAGNDTIHAGKGHDVVYGGPGNDVIFAHNGTSDYIDGGPGFDICHVDKGLDIVKNCEAMLFH